MRRARVVVSGFALVATVAAACSYFEPEAGPPVESACEDGGDDAQNDCAADGVAEGADGG